MPSLTTKERIDAMWERHMERIDLAHGKATSREEEYRRLAFSNGFYFALALMARERQLLERYPDAE